jgi:hypothetical protein
MNDNLNYGCATECCVSPMTGSMKETIMILSDEVKKANELITQIQK